MDAKEFLKEKNRLCGHYYDKNNTQCKMGCPLREKGCVLAKYPLNEYEIMKIEHIVEKWSKDHPVKTNFDMVKEALQNLGFNYPIISVCDNETLLIKANSNFWSQEYFWAQECEGDNNG